MKQKKYYSQFFSLSGFSIFVLLMFLFSCKNSMNKTKTLRGHILDARTGEPLAATVSAYAGNGLALKVDNANEYVEYLGKKRWYVDKEFMITTKEDSILLEIRHGLETIPVQRTISFRDSSNREMVFKLSRWTNMVENGYYCGDTHVHYLNPATAQRFYT